MRLVLDTNVVASALLWGGVPRLLLQAAREKGDRPLRLVSAYQGVRITSVSDAVRAMAVG